MGINISEKQLQKLNQDQLINMFSDFVTKVLLMVTQLSKDSWIHSPVRPCVLL